MDWFPSKRDTRDEIPTEYELKLIRTCYESGGRITDLARRIGKRYRWISRVAERHGFSMPRYQRPNDWKLEELNLLEENLHFTPETLRKKLAEAGYNRSRRAIRDKIRVRFGGFSTPEVYSAEELSVLLGCASTTVKKWIERGNLETRKSKNGYFEISVQDIRKFVFKYPLFLEYRKIPPGNWVWFLETITGKKIGIDEL